MYFHETKLGRIFFEHQVPQLIDAVKALTAVLSKPTPAAVLPVSADPQFLRDLFFGSYEPEIFKVSPEFQQLDRAVEQNHKSLVATLSEDNIKYLEEYEIALSERNVAVMERAYEAGIHAAMQMIMVGLSHPSAGQEKEAEVDHDC